MPSRKLSAFTLAAAFAAVAVPALSQGERSDDRAARTGATGSQTPLTIAQQGSFAVGGTFTTALNGDQSRGDHAYVEYQIPVNARKYPLVMWHGGGQFSKTWETTPDGREGWMAKWAIRNP